MYEFNASPETVLPIFDGPVGSVLYSTILLPPPSVIQNGAMKQVNRLGEDNFNDGHDQFLA